MLVAVDSQVTAVGREIVGLGSRHGHHFRFIMQAGKLVEPLYLHQDSKDYYIVPREQDDAFVPSEADRAAGLVMAAGYEVVQQLIVHDLEGFESRHPKKEEVEAEPEKEVEFIQLDLENEYEVMEERIRSAGRIGVSILKGMAVLAGAIVFVLGAVATALVTIFTLATALDPALVLVIRQEDGTHIWIEVANWPEV